MIHTLNLTRLLEPDDPWISIYQDLSTHKATYGIKLFPPHEAVFKDGRYYPPLAVLHVDFLKVVSTFDPGIFDVPCGYFPIIKDRVNKYLGIVGSSVDDFKVSRIDYAQSVVIDDKDDRFSLIDTLQLARTRGCYATRTDTYETSIYAKNNSKALQVYDKAHERKDKDFYIASYEDNVIRAEIQLKSGHLRYKEKKGVPREWDMWVNVNRYHEYIKQLTTFIYRDDFYSLNMAKLRVELSDLKDSMKNKLIRFLTVISEHGADAMDTVAKSYNTRKRYVELLASLGINPLTIPDDCYVDFIKMPFTFA